MDNLSVSIFQPTARNDPPAAKLNWLDMAADRASQSGSDILICPELSVSGYFAGDALADRAQPVLGEYSERVAEIALLHDIAIVYGYPEQSGDDLYNAAVFVTPQGRVLANHRKNHIPPGFEQENFRADHHLRAFDYKGWRIALMICYDAEFPESVRQAAVLGAELVIVPTALGAEWAFVAEKMMPTRAFENGVFLAYANWAGREGDVTYLGGSRIIGPDGKELATAGERETIISAEIDNTQILAARTRLPYLQDRIKYDP